MEMMVDNPVFTSSETSCCCNFSASSLIALNARVILSVLSMRHTPLNGFGGAVSVAAAGMAENQPSHLQSPAGIVAGPGPA
jgi:hypothetical protein